MSNLMNIQVRPYDWQEVENFTDNDHTQIRIWALDKESKSYLLKVNDFPQSFYVELPIFVGGRKYSWFSNGIPYGASAFYNALKKRLNNLSDNLYPFKTNHFSYNEKLYYYKCGQKNPMILLVFKNKETMYRARNILKYPIYIDNEKIIAKVWESEINAIRKLLTLRNISHSCWIDCVAIKTPDHLKISTLEEEYVINWTTMVRIPDEICDKWESNPGVLAFDIETYSHIHNMFPEEWNCRHPAYMISCIYTRLESNLRYRYGIIMGECNEVKPEDFENTVLFKVNDEEELVRMMGAIIIYHDPEIITGYNILGFDYPYLDARLKMKLDSWPNFSRLKNYEMKIDGQSWSSSGYGANNNKYVDCPGRISIDMLPVIKMGMFRLPTYSLSSVCRHFLGTDKHDVTAKQMFEIFEEMIIGIKAGKGTDEYKKGVDNMTKVMLYCIQDSELVLDLMEYLGTWISANETSDVAGVRIFDLYTRGQQIRCDSMVYDAASKEGYIVDKRDDDVLDFEGGYVAPPTPGLHDNVMVIDFSSLYPSIMRGYNVCYTTLVPESRWHLVPDEECNIITVDIKDYIDDPDPEDEEESEDNNNNYSKKTSKKTSKKKKDNYNLETITLKFHKYIDDSELPEEQRGRFKRGLLPKIEDRLCGTRSKVKMLMKNEKDKKLKDILDKRQMALKVCANSLYGFLGVKRGAKRSLLEGAMAICAWGRTMINAVNDYLVNTYNATIVYGDTDSTMFTLPDQVKTGADCHYWGHLMAKETTDLFPDPIAMEYEKGMRMLSLKKKKYAGLFIDKNGEFIPDGKGGYETLYKGILAARRDNCPWAKNTYTKLLEMILMRRDFLDVFNCCLDNVEDLITDRVKYLDLVIVKSLGASYKSETAFMKVFSDNLRKIGKPARPGERIPYLMIITEEEQKDPKLSLKFGEKAVTLQMYEEALAEGKEYKLDYLYYIGNILQNAADQIIGCAYGDYIDKYLGITYKPTNRHGETGMKTLCKMLYRMIKYGASLDDLRREVSKNIENIPIIDKLNKGELIYDSEEDCYYDFSC